MLNKLLTITLLSLLGYGVASAQEVVVKTNLLYGAGTLTPNLGVEFGLGQRTTLHISGGYNPWNRNGSPTDNKKLVHWLVRPEVRYWLGDRFNGHFVGVHGIFSSYNVGGYDIPLLFDKEYRYEGYAVGGGLSYGYLWNWNARWGMEFTAGAGMAYLNYDKYNCEKCGSNLGTFKKTYIGPTHAGITLIYKIGGGGKKKSTPLPIEVVDVPPVVPQPQPVVTPQPEVVAVVAPILTTAQTLATTHPFLAPIAELGDAFDTNPQQYITNHCDGSLSLYFNKGAQLLEPAYRNNQAVMNKLIDAVGQIERSADSRVVRVVIAGFASPEGKMADNDRLAHDRAVAIKNYLVANSTLTSNKIDIYNGGVDWAGLRQLVDQSNMYNKEQVLHIIDTVPADINYRTNTSRKKSLMDLNSGKEWNQMASLYFAELRNATYIKVYYDNK